MQTFDITSANGIGPYDIYLCDLTFTYCFLIGSGVNIPPTFSYSLPVTFTPPYPVTLPPAIPIPPSITFSEVTSCFIKLVDTATGCEEIFNIYCPSPTPTPTITPTPTPTPTSCKCLTVINWSAGPGTVTYTDCFGVIHYNISVTYGVPLYFCGNNPTTTGKVTASLGPPCINFSCPSKPCPQESVKRFQIGARVNFMNGDGYKFQNQ